MYGIVFNYLITIILILIGFNGNKSEATPASRYNQYLSYIFDKYGNGDTMSFEGLEHLMHSLGIGDLQFNPNHTIYQHHPNGYIIPNIIQLNSGNSSQNVSKVLSTSEKTIENLTETTAENRSRNEILFKEMHDPKHKHRRNHDGQNMCLSPESTIKLVLDDNIYDIAKNLFRNAVDSISEEDIFHDYINKYKITQENFIKICPALLVQIDGHLCPTEENNRPLIEELQQKDNALLYAFISASIALFILSACGLAGVLLIPLMKSVAYEEILKFLIAVAVGTLSGDALMHLLPHAMLSQHSSTSSETSEQELVLILFCVFGVILLMYCLENLLPLIKGTADHGHGHSHQHHHHDPNTIPVKELNTMLDEQKIDKKKPPLTPVAFMVILGDGLHNLTDGLAIGAAFAADPVTGMATAFAVLCHELPHELGDFALLLQTGMTIKRAILLNIISSVLGFLGMAIGLAITGVHTEMVRWIYAGTAGSFLYIALSDLVPEMSKNGEKNFKNAFLQIMGILIGGLIMLWIALKEDQLRVLFE